VTKELPLKCRYSDMKSPLRVLYLEDNSLDGQIVEHTLAAGGVACSIIRAATRAEYMKALEGGGIDLILADYKLPDFDGLSALKICRERHPDMPFILVTGTMGEEQAIESMQSGATDYVLKGRLCRLCPAVRRAMREAEGGMARRRAEEQFVQAQKMEVVGQLAGSVAHDFNNILSVILGYNEVILAALGPDHPLRADTEEIKHAADRAVGLTRQLLSFSRKQAFLPVPLDLNEVVAGMNNILTRLIDENVELLVIPGTNLGWVKADSGYIGQVLMNLVVNARDAMPHGGKLVVETRPVTLNNGSAARHPGLPPGDYVVLEVSDTGTGMTEEVKACLFEPFFTTKPKSKGTGLGLATCQTIVKQCGGGIEVQSELGRGSAFQVYFPRLAPSVAAAPADAKRGPAPRGKETLLLVEDEPSVRHLAVHVLRSLGYNVLSAPNGQDGLRVAQEHKGMPIHLVITDVIMPRMGGKVMAEWLKATFPQIKVLFTSGYTDDAIAQHGVLDAGVDFLPKPYTPSSIAHKVREMLDARPIPV
jgi:signal transduction histidine kinase